MGARRPPHSPKHLVCLQACPISQTWPRTYMQIASCMCALSPSVNPASNHNVSAKQAPYHQPTSVGWCVTSLQPRAITSFLFSSHGRVTRWELQWGEHWTPVDEISCASKKSAAPEPWRH